MAAGSCQPQQPLLDGSGGHLHRMADFVEEHQPVVLALVAGFRHDAGQVQIIGLDHHPRLFGDFAHGAGSGAFADVLLQLAGRWGE